MMDMEMEREMSLFPMMPEKWCYFVLIKKRVKIK
jgi:hypothetical protein